MKYLLLFLVFLSTSATAQEGVLPSVLGLDLSGDSTGSEATAVVKVFILLTVLSLAPSILIVMTPFTRILIVFSMLRHALGMPQSPPNTVLISLALFLTLFIIRPVLIESYDKGYVPLADGTITLEEGIQRMGQPFKRFMLHHTRADDLDLMAGLSGVELNEPEDVPLSVLVPAFMISELILAFKIGFMIFLPFLLIDIVVASLLMSMGMLMVPPMMMSLPIKILLFVLIDGWNLIVKALMGTF